MCHQLLHLISGHVCRGDILSSTGTLLPVSRTAGPFLSSPREEPTQKSLAMGPIGEMLHLNLFLLNINIEVKQSY